MQWYIDIRGQSPQERRREFEISVVTHCDIASPHFRVLTFKFFKIYPILVNLYNFINRALAFARGGTSKQGPQNRKANHSSRNTLSTGTIDSEDSISHISLCESSRYCVSNNAIDR